MKIRTSIMIAALALGGACKKKAADKAPDPAPKGNEPPKPDPTKPDPNAAKPDPNKPDPNAKPAPLTGDAIGKKYLDCTAMINASKLDDFKKDCLAPDYKGHEMDGMEIPNADGVIGFFKAMKTGFPDWKLEPQLVLVNGRNVFAVQLMTGTNTADWKSPDGQDMKKTDKKVGTLFFHRLAITEDGHATEEWAYSDPKTMLGQLGVLPKEAGPVRPAMKGMAGAPVIVIAADDAKEKANLELSKKADAAFNSHKEADVAAMWTDDGVESDQSQAKDAKGKKEIAANAKFFYTAFPDVKVESPNVWAAGDYVVNLGVATGTNTGPMGPMKATGKKVTLNYAEISKVKDNKIAEIWRFYNGMAMAAQMGLMPEPGKAGAAPKGEAPKGGTAPKKEEKKAGGGW